MFTPATALSLDVSQKQALETMARAGRTPQVVARKCKVILLASEGVSNNGIAQQTGLSRPTVIATRTAFSRGGVEAIGRRQKRKRVRRGALPAWEEKVSATTFQTRAPLSTPCVVLTLSPSIRPK